MTTDNISSECRSFFWVYAPVKMVEPKKQKVDDVSTYLHQLSKTKASANPVLAKIGDTEHTHDIDQRHISIAEQYRSGDHFHDYQPMETADEIKAIVDSLQGAAHHYDPIKLGGSSLEMIQRGNKVHITLQFNSECAQVFEAIHEDIRANLGNQTRFGGVKPLECPRLFLAKGYNHELRGHDLSACCASFNHSHNRFKTKPVLLDRLVLGQGFFTEDGKNVARRDIATIDLGGGLEWHCPNPFDFDLNDNFIQNYLDKNHGPNLAKSHSRPLPAA